MEEDMALEEDHPKESGLMDADGKKIHPLLIDHVAKNIFGNFQWDYSNTDLRTCRVVCKTWCDIITHRMKVKRKERKLIFQRPNDGELLQRFVRDMENSTNPPFHTFEFKEHFFLAKNTEIFCQFCESFANVVESLAITIGKQYTLNLAILVDKNIEFENLQNLSIMCTEVETNPMPASSLSSTSCSWMPQHPDSQAEGLQILLKIILEKAHNLKSVELNVPPKCIEGNNRAKIHERICDIFSNGLPDSVTSLKIFMKLRDIHLQRLSSLKLQDLDIEFYGKEITQQTLQDFIRSHSSSLKSLRLMDYDGIHGDTSLDLTFPKVKTLSVNKNGTSFEFLRSFPKLEQLTFLNCANREVLKASHSNVSEKVVCSSVNTLEIKFALENPYFIQSCFDCFPNLTTLKIYATLDSKSSIERIYELMTGLRELHIAFIEPFKHQPVDPLISGVPLALCLQIREEGDRELEQYASTSNLNFGLRFPGMVQRGPCLIQLKYLRKLVIESEYKSIFMTDISIRCGLFLMPFLEEVDLHFKSEHGISQKCLNDLRARVRLNITSEGSSTVSDPYSMALVPVL